MRGYSYEFVLKVRTLAKGKNAPVGVQLGLKAVESGMPIKQIATKLGVSRMTVYDWFTGKYQPSAQHLKRLMTLVGSK